MIPLLIIGGLFVLYEVLHSQIAAALVMGHQPQGAPGIPGGALGNELALPSFTDVAPQGGDQMALQSAVQANAAAMNFIPVVGPAVSAIFSLIAGGLVAASAKRRQEAISENHAVANAVPGFDAAVAQVVRAYNAGQITEADCEKFFGSPQTNQQGLLWKNYWNEVTPQIQPDRNGCHGGADPHSPPLFHCQGSYGAACCVGYDDLDNALLYLLQAVRRADAGPCGKTVTSNTLPTVVASKYGGIDRPGYTVTFVKHC